MLNRVEISGFRTCRNVVLESLRPVTALVGPSGGGKTSILEAIERTAWAASGWYPMLSRNPRDLMPTGMKIELSAGERSYAYELKLNRADDTIKETVYVRDVKGKYCEQIIRDRSSVELVPEKLKHDVPSDTSCLPMVEQVFSASELAKRIAGDVLRTFRNVRYHSADGQHAPEGQWFDIYKLSREPSGITNDLYERYRQTKESTSALPWWSTRFELFDLQQKNRPVFNEIKSLLGPSGLDILDDISVRDTTRIGNDAYRFVLFRPARTAGSSPMEFEELSHGVRRVVEIVVAVVANRGSVLLWDHPEDGIDQELLEKTVSLMRTYCEGGQLILATHSPTVLNSLQSDEVQLVRLADGETVARPLSAEEAQTAREYIDDTGTLAEFIEMLQEV